MNITLKLHQVVAVPVVRYFVVQACLNLATVVPADMSLGCLVEAVAVGLGPAVVMIEDARLGLAVVAVKAAVMAVDLGLA